MLCALALSGAVATFTPGARGQQAVPPEPAVEAPSANVPEHPSANETPTAPSEPGDEHPAIGAPAANAGAAGATAPRETPRRQPSVHMFSGSDDRAERERMRRPGARRRVAGEPEVLELAGMPDAWFFRPSVGGTRRVFVYLHSRGANPREACQRFATVVPRYGWLVCPVGPGHRGGGRYVWNNNATLARRYSVAAVNALRARFPRRVRATDNVVMGFSEGAFVAMQTGLAEPTIFPRWVIFASHDGYVGMNSELYPAARRALRKVYLITGAGDEIVERSRRAAEFMRRQRLGRVELRILPRAAHELPPDFAPTVRRALTWVTAR